MKANRHLAAWAGLIAWSGLLISIAYGAALSLPFLADDFFQMPFVDAHSLTEIWQTAEGLYYFRPLSFTVWKLLYHIQGRHDPATLHAFNLLLHWGNSLLVAWLAGRLWAESMREHERIAWARRYLSATLFLLYPFSYEVVPWIAAVMHSLVTTLVLLSILSYLKWRETNSRAWGLLSIMFAFLGPFAHETGALITPLIVVIELTQPSRSEPLRRRIHRVALWALPILLWFFIWQAVPTPASGETVGLNPVRNLLRNSLYFMQGTAYPLAWLGGWVRDTFGSDGLVVAAGLSVLTLATAAFVQWRSGANRLSWLPWLWVGVTALPAIFFLPFSYVSAAPRVLMLASVGVAWLWSDVFLYLANMNRITPTGGWSRVGVSAGLCLAVLIQNYGFVRDRMQIYGLGGSVIHQAIVKTVAANEAGQAAIFINLPTWVAPSQAAYAIGQEGFAFMPAAEKLDTLVSVSTGHPANIHAIRFDAIQQEVAYYHGLMESTSNWTGLAQSRGQVFVVQYAPDRIETRPVGELAVVAPAAEPIAHFESAIDLLDAAATLSSTQLRIDLIWRVREPPEPDITLFVHLFDANGQLAAQADGDPLAGAYPFWQWPPGSIARDRRSIEVSGSDLSLRVGLYNRATGERLAAAATGGAPFIDNAVPITIRAATNSIP